VTRLVLASAVLAALAHPGVADPTPPARLTMQYVDGEAIHLADQRGAINRHRRVDLAVELRAGNKLAATARGTSSEHNLYESFSTDEVTTWTNTWTGGWSRTGKTLALSLVLANRTCSHTKTATGAKPETLACGLVTTRLELVCKAEQVAVQDVTGSPTSPVDTTRRHAAWRCTPIGPADLAETPADWVLGETVCVQTAGSRRGPTSYARCEP
jgi:hypothetical protein